MDKGLLFATIIQMPIGVCIPLVTTYLSKMVVELVSNQASVESFVVSILALCFGSLGLAFVNHYLSAKIKGDAFVHKIKYMDIYHEKIMELDYELLEKADTQNKSRKAIDGIIREDSGPQQIFTQLKIMGSNIVGLITYSFLLISFNLWIVLLLFGMTIMAYFFSKRHNRWVHKNKDNWVPIDRKIGYIRRKAGDFLAAKDIYLFDMSTWFNQLFEEFLGQRKVWWKKGEKRGFWLDVMVGLMNFLRDGLAYMVLIYEVAKGNLSAADFVFYFALIAQYSGWLMGIISGYATLEETSLSLCDLREFLDIPNQFNREKGVEIGKGAPEIRLNNVSFRYTNQEKDTLKKIKLTINAGEKIALVGLNGAGKTTLVKLLCGLYVPTQGEILVHHESILKYHIEEYYTMLSVVFQDILLMPVSIAKNIALCPQQDIEQERIKKVLKLSGLYDKVMSLEEKENTLLVKSMHEKGTDLSGGEKQKLALARGLYKNGNILILDEPTAALDPIAENELYEKYHELTQSKTSIFISHRLSSTRFCDRILFLENGEILEQGSHQELMELQGKYAQLFELQSHYYQKEVIS